MRGRRKLEGGGFPEAEAKKPLLRLEDEDADGVDGALLFDATLGWKSEVLSEPEESEDADRLFSATTLRDFSNTFQSLMVLSGEVMIYMRITREGRDPLFEGLSALHAHKGRERIEGIPGGRDEARTKKGRKR